ncbi:unnamed protein product [Protopolystoma xenopodis]|uniref:Uncharacterized protein n=1 Tax=Protopolystoma xenopodis TaxID=117903 RepID=A0A448X682_9PLAT|nr:unnamed protein product [Protopolystoma xenopodis]
MQRLFARFVKVWRSNESARACTYALVSFSAGLTVGGLLAQSNLKEQVLSPSPGPDIPDSASYFGFQSYDRNRVLAAFASVGLPEGDPVSVYKRFVVAISPHLGTH